MLALPIAHIPAKKRRYAIKQTRTEYTASTRRRAALLLQELALLRQYIHHGSAEEHVNQTRAHRCVPFPYCIGETRLWPTRWLGEEESSLSEDQVKTLMSP